MTIYTRPDGLVFAELAGPGEVIPFPDILRGWGLTFDQTEGKPPMEWMNAAFQRVDEAVRYIVQRGVSEWSATEDYPIGAYTQHGGKLYRSLLASTNVAPGTAALTWLEVAPDASTAIKGLVQLHNALTSSSTTLALTAAQGKVLNDAKADKTLAITAGNGMSGGGDLSAARTIMLGTPGAITGTSTNAVTASSHTHAVDAASTTVPGVVQLNNTLTSTSAAQALTAAQGKALQDSKANNTVQMIAGNGLSGGGTLAANRTLTLGTPETITGTSTNAVSTAGHSHALTLAGADVTAALGFTPPNQTVQVTAGNGLSGGGAISATRTITLGTPGSLTASTINAVTTTSHTHDVTIASATVQGLVELATPAEVVTGTDSVRAVTPAGLKTLTATEARAGLVELATAAEAQALLDDARALTPKKLADAFGGANQSLTAASGYQRLPGGLILQMGYSQGFSAYTVTLPTSFPNGPIGQPIANSVGTSVEATGAAAFCETSPVVSNQFKIFNYAPAPGGGAANVARSVVWYCLGW